MFSITRNWRSASSLTALLLLSMTSNTNAATYQLDTVSEYFRSGVNSFYVPSTYADAQGVTGTIEIDTGSGELLSMNLNLGTYQETIIYTNPQTDYAIYEYAETQTLNTSTNGTVNGTVITFSGVNFSAGGAAGCIFGTGVNGTSNCNNFNGDIPDWTTIDLVFLLTANAEVMEIQASWNTAADGINYTHQLDLLAVQEVPLPGAALLMISALCSLFGASRLQQPKA